MYFSTPIYPFLCEMGLTPASITLDNRQRLYIYQLLNLPKEHLKKKILSVSLRIEDKAFDNLPENNLIWTQNT